MKFSNDKDQETKSEVMPIVENKVKSIKKNIAICPVIDVISKTKVVIVFKNFGLIVNTHEASILKGKNIEIEYSGTIGKNDFKFEVKRCIK